MPEAAERGAGTSSAGFQSKRPEAWCRPRGCGPAGPPHLVRVMEEPSPQLQQGQSRQHGGGPGPPGEGHQQGRVGVLQAAQAVQGVGPQEARRLVFPVQLHQEHGQLVHAVGVPAERVAGGELAQPILRPLHLPSGGAPGKSTPGPWSTQLPPHLTTGPGPGRTARHTRGVRQPRPPSLTCTWALAARPILPPAWADHSRPCLSFPSCRNGAAVGLAGLGGVWQAESGNTQAAPGMFLASWESACAPTGRSGRSLGCVHSRDRRYRNPRSRR